MSQTAIHPAGPSCVLLLPRGPSVGVPKPAPTTEPLKGWDISVRPSVCVHVISQPKVNSPLLKASVMHSWSGWPPELFLSNPSVSPLHVQTAPAHIAPLHLNKKSQFHDALVHQNREIKPAIFCISKLSDKFYKLLNLKRRWFKGPSQYSNSV